LARAAFGILARTGSTGGGVVAGGALVVVGDAGVLDATGAAVPLGGAAAGGGSLAHADTDRATLSRTLASTTGRRTAMEQPPVIGCRSPRGFQKSAGSASRSAPDIHRNSLRRGCGRRDHSRREDPCSSQLGGIPWGRALTRSKRAVDDGTLE
jgi:hypothetical protein